MEKMNTMLFRKINTRFRKFTGIGLVTLALIMVVLSSVAAQQDTGVAIVVRINGALQYRENASSDWKPAKVNQVLSNGYQLRTETGNKAMILYVASSNRVLINENTELELQTEATTSGGKPNKERTKLMIGEVFSRVKEGSNYEVETPTSVASVRGTEFNANFSEGGEATYLVFDNSMVEVMNQLGSVLLRQLQTVSIKTGDTPTDDKVQTLTQNQANNAVNWTNNVAPTWKLNISPEGGGAQEMGRQFALTIWAQDPQTSSIDANATFALTGFEASSDVLEFSTDSGKTWTNAPRVTLSNGQARVVARAVSEGSCDITVTAENAEPSKIQITVQKAKQKIKIELKFTLPDGTDEKTITLDLEEK